MPRFRRRNEKTYKRHPDCHCVVGFSSFKVKKGMNDTHETGSADINFLRRASQDYYCI
jgi:hypothetical protein